MTVISPLSSAISGTVAQSPVGATAKGAATATDTQNATPFGPAVVVDLSADGQAAATTPTSSVTDTDTGSDSSTAASGTASSGGGGGGAPVSSSSTTSEELADEVATAKREVAAQVGTTAANQLVDSKGNIDRVGLAKEVARLAQAKQAAGITA